MTHENNENYENLRIPCENHQINKNLTIPNENHENHRKS